MSEVFINLLKKSEEKILISLEPFFNKKGFLSGGTALMLQKPIRRSYVFDLFFPHEIPSGFVKLASKAFNSQIEILVDNWDELTFIANSIIKVSFIFFPFKRKYKPVVVKNFIKLSSYKDIASDKAYAIGRRSEYRDYVDLFIILKNGFSFSQVIADAKEKFSGQFSEKLFLSKLVYFEDIKDFNVEFLKEKYSVEEVKNFFQSIVSNYNFLH